MPIPEGQLETWSHQGSVAQSSQTYQTIKRTLEATGTGYSGKSYQVFLQGSYGNDTNIWAESDVDIVIRLDDCWQYDLSDLSEPEKRAYRGAYVDAAYTHVEFKHDVVQALSGTYGRDVEVGDKAIKIAAGSNRRSADVIAALQYRRYQKFNSASDQTYTQGICFWNAAGEMIANFPKQHSANLTARHQAANQWLKPMARVLKNLRSRLIDEGLLNAGVAPSYYLEGLLYNVPSDNFTTSYEDCFVNSINWLRDVADKDQLVCANEQYYLLRDGYQTCWPKANAEAFLTAAVQLWHDW